MEIQPGFTSTGKWYELFSGDSVNVTDMSARLSLEAGEYRLYSRNRIESVISGTIGTKEELLMIYPNPAEEFLHIDYKGRIDRIEVIGLEGSVLISRETTGTMNSIDISGLDAGMYFLRIRAGENTITQRIIIN